MKAWLEEFGGSVLKKAIILGLIVLAVAVIIFFATRPVISESVLKTVTREDGRYSLDGLHAGMTRDEVAAQLDARHLIYADGEMSGIMKDGQYTDMTGTSWISLSDETRVKELGHVTVRRTYYFSDGLLTHVDLKTDEAKGRIDDDIKRFYQLLDSLTSKFGKSPDSTENLPLDLPGEWTIRWRGEDGTGLTVIARRYDVDDWEKRSGQTIEVSSTSYFVIVIRVEV